MLPQLCQLLMSLVASKAFRSTFFSISICSFILRAPYCRMGHQFQILGQPLHGGLAALNSSVQCLYAWWWWCYSLMLLLQSYLVLLLLLIFGITFTILTLLEYYKQELYCHTKKAVSFRLSYRTFWSCLQLLSYLLTSCMYVYQWVSCVACSRELRRRVNVCAGGLSVHDACFCACVRSRNPGLEHSKRAFFKLGAICPRSHEAHSWGGSVYTCTWTSLDHYVCTSMRATDF